MFRSKWIFHRLLHLWLPIWCDIALRNAFSQSKPTQIQESPFHKTINVSKCHDFVLKCHNFTLQCHDLVLEHNDSVLKYHDFVLKRHDFERLFFNYELLTFLMQLRIFVVLSMNECLYSTFPLSQWTPVLFHNE